MIGCGERVTRGRGFETHSRSNISSEHGLTVFAVIGMHFQYAAHPLFFVLGGVIDIRTGFQEA